MSVRLSLWDWQNIQHLGFVSTNNEMAGGSHQRQVAFFKDCIDIFLPAALAEEVIFSVASMCVRPSVCTLQAEPLDLRT